MRLVAIEYTVVNVREKGRFMATMTLSRLRQARYAILGFGCNQAFLFAMLYLGSYNESSQHGFLIDRADLLCVLLVMAATFALMTRERRRRHLMVVAEGLVRCYALPLVGALYLIVALHSLAPGIPWLALAAVEGLAAGVPLALLLCRWGRVLGEASIDQSVPEVFIGSALGAAVCFFVVAIPVEGAYILLYVLPVGSAWALRALGEPDDRDAEPAAADDPTEEAAKLSGVSESTVVRFASELGYDGYPSMQRALQEMIRSRLTSTQRIQAADNLFGGQDVLSAVIQSDMDKLRMVAEEADRTEFNKVVDLILGAGHLYILGVRTSSFVAGYLNFYLHLLSENVTLVQSNAAGEIFEQLLRIGPGDVMIAISFPRYSKVTMNTVKFAQDRGATIVAITDNELSPVYQMAEAALLAPSEMISFVDSMVAPLSLINALLIAVGSRMRSDVSRTFAELEDIWNAYGVFGKMDDE